MVDLRSVMRHGESSEYGWTFWEDSPEAETDCLATIPALIVFEMKKSASPDKAVGLLVAYAARRSLPAWFNYCRSDVPLCRIQTVIDAWMGRVSMDVVTDESCVPCIPMEGSKMIADCRAQETRTASSAVANAAKYARYRKEFDAITSLSHAYTAVNISPVMGIATFKEWICDFAGPAASSGSDLSQEEAFALADFYIPNEMRKALR